MPKSTTKKPAPKAKQPTKAAGAKPNTSPARVTKPDAILKLLLRRQGATVEQLQAATGWKSHSIRAALTGLRKKGHAIERTKDKEGLTVYTAAKAPTA